MGYTLQAIIARSPLLSAVKFPHTLAVPLEQGLELVPLVSAACEALGLEFLTLTDGGESELPPSFSSRCCEIAAHGKAAYIEAEYHGGDGIQACVMFHGAQQVGPVVVAGDAINQALRFLGVSRNPGKDEFSSVGFGTQRHTDDWLSA